MKRLFRENGISFKNMSRHHQIRRRVFSVLVAAVVFVTTYALVIPVITASASVYCGLDEHTHSDACYENVLVCGFEDGEDGHVHDASCYETQLVCDAEEHVHSLACYSDPEADVELTEDWEATIPTNLSGYYAKDLIAVAKSQLNYKESEKNYEVAEDGVGIRGYSRYGDWNGEPYANWSMDFVAFSLFYAGIDEQAMPVNTESVDEWIKDLTEAGLVKEIDEELTAGDLVFLQSEDKNGEEVPHVGILIKQNKKNITLIEGDRDDAVAKTTYAKNSDQIVAVAGLPNQEAEVAEGLNGDGVASGADDASVTESTDEVVESEEDAAAVDESVDESDKTNDQQNENDYNLSFQGDGYTVLASYNEEAGLPDGTELAVEEIRENGEQKDTFNEYYEQTEAALSDEGSSLVSARFFDISFEKNGKEIEPTGDVDISITFEKDVTEGFDSTSTAVKAVHLPDGSGPEVIDASASDGENDAEETVRFTAESFSVYGIVYTVDFTYEVDGKTYEFSLDGGSTISLSSLVEALGISDQPKAFVAGVESVEFSDPDLVWVGQEEESDDWTLISLQPFDTEESLTVTMKNGEQFVIEVTDAHEISDSSASTIDVNKSYLICYEVNGTYYLLKNDGSVDSSHAPANFEGLNSTYCWTLNYVFEEKHLEETLTYTYYLIRPIDNKSKTIALNAEGQDLVQRSNNNVAVVPADDGGFHLIGYNEVKLNFENGIFFADQLPEGNDGIVVHIYEMDSLPTYDYTVRSSDETRGTVIVDGGTQRSETHDGVTTHYYEASSNSDKKNAGKITATPVNHRDGQGDNKWLFDYWTQDGIPLDRDHYSATINTNTLPIPFNGSKLVAHFKQNPAYDVPDSEKEPTTFDDMTQWLDDLTTKHVPLDESKTEKTAEVYDYENRIYRVDITSDANFRTFNGNVDMAFCLDVSNSMKFPSKLEETASSNYWIWDSGWVTSANIPIYQINNNNGNKGWLDTSRGWDDPYYLIADTTGTATVFKIYYQNGSWKAQDASRQEENVKSFVIGQSFHTNWCDNDNYPFNAGDNGNTTYTIYDAGDEGRNRFYYLNSSLLGATTDLKTIKETLEVAGADSPQVKVAYNTFNKCSSSDNGNLPSGYTALQSQDFQTVEPLQVNFSYSAGGGTRPDRAFVDLADENSFHWSGNDKYVVLITDGAPQGVRDTFGESSTETTPEVIYNKVRTAAQNLKTQEGVKFITIGLSMENVTSGKNLLYDLADTDADGNKMFYMAESASDLPNILRQIIDTVMDDAVVYADVTDTVGEAFYPVDKSTGLPLKPGDMIDIEGRKTNNQSEAAGIVQNDGITIKWLNQAIDPTNGWHGTVYVKAKEDLIGGNAVKTNGDADITATKYKMGDKEYTFESSLIADKLKSLKIEFPTPRVNVNELTFPKTSTEWTVYLGANVDPEEQLKKMYEDILVTEVINTDGSLHYPIEPNSIQDDRTGGEHGTAKTFALAPVILEMLKADATLSEKYVQNNNLNWDAFLTDILKEGGVTVPYHPYGIEGEDSNIVIKLTKEILEGEESDLVNKSPHATTVVNGTAEDGSSLPVEKYVLTVQYNPDYDHVLPPGQGGKNPNAADYHTGTFGTMYQGHATGRETSTNEHIINVFAKKLKIVKVDQEQNQITESEAEFALYRKATVNDPTSSIVTNPVEGLSGDYVLVQELKTTGGTVTTDLLPLLKGDEDYQEPYYLVETKAPAGYNPTTDVLYVRIDMTGHNTWTPIADESEARQTKPDPYVVSNWTQAAIIKVTDDKGENSGRAIVIIPEGQQGIAYDSITDTTDASVGYKILNDAGYELPSTGGPGTVRLYLAGALIAAAAGAGLVLKRRRSVRGGGLLR